MKVLVIIPVYNEQEAIEETVHTLTQYCDTINKEQNMVIDYLIINDGSKDSTELILRNRNFSHVSLLCNLGIGGAVQTGYRYALERGYDIAVQCDGDGQHNPVYIPTIIEPLTDGADLCIGSRFIDETSSKFKSTLARRVGIRLISEVIRLVTGKHILDPTSGFRAVNRKTIEFFSDHYPTEYPEPESIVELLKLNYTIVERPVSMNERQGGTSSIRAFKTVYYMINVCLSIIVTGMKRKDDLI